MGSRVQLSVEQYFQNTCSAVSFEQSCIVRGEQTFQWELLAITIVAIVDTREIDREVFVVVARFLTPPTSASDNESNNWSKQWFNEPDETT